MANLWRECERVNFYWISKPWLTILNSATEQATGDEKAGPVEFDSHSSPLCDSTVYFRKRPLDEQSSKGLFLLIGVPSICCGDVRKPSDNNLSSSGNLVLEYQKSAKTALSEQGARSEERRVLLYASDD